ncbi:hypothetical protein [Actinokineospora globicatena]|uniref:Uncharacterized protein n=1 Tax=Actinokineospora globicatena TaxID=103729 RepID=A0A9W6VC86_9PSEU|nr:hypothetical protein [Actinokineospora globicatena]GLW93966.1 hypothetical protein Aglo03_47820 [Actinokineospora globicatena]
MGRDEVAGEVFGGERAGEVRVWEEGDAVTALKYSYLFWPCLVEVDGAVFVRLDGNSDSGLAELVKERAVGYRGGWADCVDSYNRFEVEQLFRAWHGQREWDGELHWELGEVLVRTWRARLAEGYPDRRFEVLLLEPEDGFGTRIDVRQVTPAVVTPDWWRG